MTNPAPVTFFGRLWRFTKRLTLFATVSAIFVGAAGYFALPVVARTPWAVRKTEKALARAMGTPVQIGDMRLSWRDGLTLRDVSTPEDFSAKSIRINPRGNGRVTVVLTGPRMTLDPSASTIRLPRFSKRGFKFDKIEIRDGTYVVKSPTGSRDIRIEQISTQASGRLGKGAFTLDLQSVNGTLDGMALAGKGKLRVTPEGLAGELSVTDPAMESATLRDALGAANVTLKKAPVLSDPF